MAQQQTLADLLASLFSASELRRFVRYGPDGDRMSRELDSRSSLADLAQKTVDLYEGSGTLDQVWPRLERMRPYRRDDIWSVRDAMQSPQQSAMQQSRGGPAQTQLASGNSLSVLHVQVGGSADDRSALQAALGAALTASVAPESYPDLLQHIREHPSRVLHIEGASDSPTFQDGTEVTGESLARMLQHLAKREVTFAGVVLSRCLSREDGLELRASVTLDFVVGIPDGSQGVIRALYKGLQRGDSVSDAFEDATFLADSPWLVPESCPLRFG